MTLQERITARRARFGHKDQAGTVAQDVAAARAEIAALQDAPAETVADLAEKTDDAR